MKTLMLYILIAILLTLSFYQPIKAQDNTISIQKNISYVINGTSEQQMDIYLPAKKDIPLILYLHEGSLVSGDKSDNPYEQIAMNFAKKDIGFIIINYRLGPKNKWPTMAEDAALAFSWITKNTEKLHANPHKLFIVGHSSGALIASLLATDQKYLQKVSNSLSEIAGCVVMGTMLNPSYDTDSIPKDSLDKLWLKFETRDTYESLFKTAEDYRDADPYRHITRNAPPFLILIAEAEQVNPPILEQAKRFAIAERKLNVSFEIEVLENRTHMTAMKKMAEANDPAFLKIIHFIETH